MSYEQLAKEVLSKIDKRFDRMEESQKQVRSVLRFVLELQKEQALQHDRVYKWMAALFDTLSESELGEKLKGHPFYDQGSQPAVRQYDGIAPNIDALIDQLK